MKLLAVALAGIVLLLLCGAVATLVIARVIETRYPPPAASSRSRADACTS